MSVSTEVDILEATMEFNVEIYVGMNMGTTWRKILIEMWKYKMNKKRLITRRPSLLLDVSHLK